jgi:hypothetical protein
MHTRTGGELWHFLQRVEIFPNGEKFYYSPGGARIALTGPRALSCLPLAPLASLLPPLSAPSCECVLHMCAHLCTHVRTPSASVLASRALVLLAAPGHAAAAVLAVPTCLAGESV